MVNLGKVIRTHGIHFHTYADDKGLYIALSPEDLQHIDELLFTLHIK